MFLQWNHSVKKTVLSKTLTVLLLCTFLNSFIIPPYAIQAQTMVQPGLLAPSVVYTPTLLKGLTLYPENPLKFDFIIDVGNSNLQDQLLVDETTKLIKYFLATITVPKDELWVNLSPYEGDRIIPQNFGETEMGRDLLAQDYILKQFTSSLMYPDGGIGKKMWDRIYDQARAKYGTTKIPVDTFKKVWIVPENAKVYIHENSAFVVNSHLKVMLEEDYLAMRKNLQSNNAGMEKLISQTEEMSDVAAKVMREVVLPEIEKEVNQGEQFAALRQVYNSMILAIWYKQTLRESLLGHVYADQNKIKGVESGDVDAKNRIYEQYLTAFKEGAYNYIREDYDPVSKEIIPRAYFSGGAVAPENVTQATSLAELTEQERASLSGSSPSNLRSAQTDLTEFGPQADINSAIVPRNETVPSNPLEVVDSEQDAFGLTNLDDIGVNSAVVNNMAEVKAAWETQIDPQKDGSFKGTLGIKDETALLKEMAEVVKKIKVLNSDEQSLVGQLTVRIETVKKQTDAVFKVMDKLQARTLEEGGIDQLTLQQKNHVFELMINVLNVKDELIMLRLLENSLVNDTQPGAKELKDKVVARKAEVQALIERALVVIEKFQAGQLTQDEIAHMTTQEKANALALIPLGKFKGQAKMLLYSAAPGSGKGAVMDQTFGKRAPLAWMGEKLLLYHSRAPRKGEIDGASYHFRTPNQLLVLEEQQKIRTAFVNKQMQGNAPDEFTEIVRIPARDVHRQLLPTDEILLNAAEILQDGDVILDQLEARGEKVERGASNVKEPTMLEEDVVVLRKVQGLAQALKRNKLTVMEGGYDWFRKFTPDAPDMFTIFIVPFNDDQIRLRGQNQQKITNEWSDPLHRMVAYGMLNMMRQDKKYNREDLKLTDPVIMEDLKTRVDKWFRDLSAGVPEETLLPEIKRVPRAIHPKGYVISDLVQDAQNIEGRLVDELNMTFKEYFGIERVIEAGSLEAEIAKTLAYEIQWKMAGDVERGDTDPKLDVPTTEEHRQAREGSRVYDKPQDMFNRTVEGVVQVFYRQDYKRDSGRLGAVVENKFEYDKAKVPAALKDLADRFSGQYLNYLLIQLQREVVEDRVSLEVDKSFLNEKWTYAPEAPKATNASVLANQAGSPVGGIDLNPDFLDLQIERDTNGVPLPVYDQPLNTMQIEGFIPVIINIYPVTNLPLLIGAAQDGSDTQGADGGVDRMSRLQPFFQKEERSESRRGDLSFLLN